MIFDLFIKNGMVHTGGGFQKADIGVTGEKIAWIGNCYGVEARRVIDAAGKYVLPGMIDFHTHIREPGVEAKEDYTTGTMAAAHGGVTGVCVIPNNLTRGIASVEDFRYAVDYGERHAVVDFAPIPSPLAFHKESLPELVGAGASYFKIMEMKNSAPLEENFCWVVCNCFTRTDPLNLETRRRGLYPTYTHHQVKRGLYQKKRGK